MNKVEFYVGVISGGGAMGMKGGAFADDGVSDVCM